MPKAVLLLPLPSIQFLKTSSYTSITALRDSFSKMLNARNGATTWNPKRAAVLPTVADLTKPSCKGIACENGENSGKSLYRSASCRPYTSDPYLQANPKPADNFHESQAARLIQEVSWRNILDLNFFPSHYSSHD